MLSSEVISGSVSYFRSSLIAEDGFVLVSKLVPKTMAVNHCVKTIKDLYKDYKRLRLSEAK